MLDRARRGHVDALILDVKDVSGLVVYPSRIAPHFSEWSRYTRGTSDDRPFPAGYDLLRRVVDQGHARGLHVYAADSVFMEGTHLPYARIGPVWKHPDWEQVIYRGGHLSRISLYHKFIYVSPLSPRVRRRELGILEEIARYPVDGIVLDYCQFAGRNADYSPAARRAFEADTGVPVRRWPQEALPGGDRWLDWLRWRALAIKGFVIEARKRCRRFHPGLEWAAYYDGYYPAARDTGTNWAPPAYPGGRWPETSLAGLYDFLCLGFYVPQVTRRDRAKAGPSIEALADAAERVMRGAKPVLGSVYVKLFVHRARPLSRAVQVIQDRDAGAMLYDLSWVRRLGLWSALEAVPARGGRSSHAVSAFRHDIPRTTSTAPAH